jgi:heat shock protein beta
VKRLLGSSKSGDKLISLDQYIVRMKPGQKQIYYITGQDKKQLEKSPLLENLLKRGYEVPEISIVLVPV